MTKHLLALLALTQLHAATTTQFSDRIGTGRPFFVDVTAVASSLYGRDGAGVWVMVPNSTFALASSFTGTSSGANTGDITLGAFGSAPDAKGFSLSGQVLTLQPADATHPGAVTIDEQTLAGDKTFSGFGTFGGGLAVNDSAMNFGAGLDQVNFFGGSGAMFRAALGVEIGTNVQAYDSDLASWSAITPGTETAAAVTSIGDLTGVVTSTNRATAIADAALSIAKTSGLQTTLDAKAPLASPTFTGTVTSPAYVATGQSLTGSQSTKLIDLSTTWNTSGAPVMLYGRVTNTSSGLTAYLVDLGTVADGSLFRVTKSGSVVAESYGGAGTGLTGTATLLTAGNATLAATASAVAASGITGTTLASNVVTSSLTSVGALSSGTFTTSWKSTTALATPSALSATEGHFYASTVSGASIGGYGTTNDVTLRNRAGTVCLGVGPNTTTINIPGTLNVSGGITSQTLNLSVSGNKIWFSGDGGSGIKSPSNGIIQLTNNSENGFTRLDFGGVTSSFAALQTSGTGITTGLADGTAGGSFTASGTLITTPDTRSGPGAVSITTSATKLVTTGTLDALTLANGATEGQIKTIAHTTDGGSAVLTPTSGSGFTTVTFTNVGESVTLQWFTGGWVIISIRGAVAA